MASISAAYVKSNIRHHIHHALFGTRGPARDQMCKNVHNLDDVHQLSQEFSLASSMGGGGMLAIQALGHQAGFQRRDCRE